MPIGPIGSTGPIGVICPNELMPIGAIGSIGPIGAICSDEMIPIGPIGIISSAPIRRAATRIGALMRDLSVTIWHNLARCDGLQHFR